jgi:hypothetical protein
MIQRLEIRSENKSYEQYGTLAEVSFFGNVKQDGDGTKSYFSLSTIMLMNHSS